MQRQALRNFLRRSLLVVPDVIKYISGASVKALGGYEQVRGEYWASVYDAVEQFLLHAADVSITGFKNSMYNAMNSAFQTGAELGYVDGGGEVPLDKETQAWLDGEITAEKSNIDSLFSGLRENWESKDAINEAFARADGYASKLDSIYSQAMINGANNPLLQWVEGDTEKKCATCLSLDGKWHRAQWYIDNNYIPGMPYASMDCGGHNCKCKLVDKDGKEYTL